MIMKRWVMYAVRVDDSRLHFCNPRYQVISVSSAWIKEIPHFFNITSSGQIKDLKNVSSTDREWIRRDYNKKAVHKWFYSTTTIYASTVIMTHGNLRVNYLGQVFKLIGCNWILSAKCRQTFSEVICFSR